MAVRMCERGCCQQTLETPTAATGVMSSSDAEPPTDWQVSELMNQARHRMAGTSVAPAVSVTVIPHDLELVPTSTAFIWQVPATELDYTLIRIETHDLDVLDGIPDASLLKVILLYNYSTIALLHCSQSNPATLVHDLRREEAMKFFRLALGHITLHIDPDKPYIAVRLLSIGVLIVKTLNQDPFRQPATLR
jgi:hypothetical protein